MPSTSDRQVTMSIDELVQHMSAGLFVPELKATTKTEALEELTAAAVRGSAINDQGTILEMLSNREQLGSTALEKGVAFPHGRSLAVKSLTVLVARSKAGVDFESEDGRPTHLFFLILAPPQDTGNYYLQALGKIAELVRKDEVCNGLMEVADFEALVQLLRESE
jgi:fructose-specific phosphotransferase system IIA component